MNMTRILFLLVICQVFLLNNIFLIASVVQKPARVQKVFAKYGPIRSLRFRSICVESTPISHFDKKLLKKASVIQNKLSEDKKCVNAYIVYKDKESVDAALELNNMVFIS